MDWARLLLDVDSTEDMLITVNREKIGQELLRLRSENSRLTALINKLTGMQFSKKAQPSQLQ